MPEIFTFGRSSRLREVFPTSAAGGDLTLSELLGLVLLTHPAIPPAEGAPFRNFSLSGANGVNTLDLTPTPANLIQYYIGLNVQHNDGATPQRISIRLFDTFAGLGVVLYDTATDVGAFPGGVASTGVPVIPPLPLIVPAGYHIRAIALTGLGAGAALTITGAVAVRPVSEPPPPLF